jgi:hypothetical protein
MRVPHFSRPLREVGTTNACTAALEGDVAPVERAPPPVALEVYFEFAGTHLSQKTRKMGHPHLTGQPAERATKLQSRSGDRMQHTAHAVGKSEEEEPSPAGCPISRVLCEKWGFPLLT